MEVLGVVLKGGSLRLQSKPSHPVHSPPSFIPHDVELAQITLVCRGKSSGNISYLLFLISNALLLSA
jgi:hypothetical protein